MGITTLELEVERISAHKAMLAKSSAVFEAFKLFNYSIYGRTIRMEAINSYQLLANLADKAVQPRF